MSIFARTALYFKYSVSARFKLSPAPSSAKEVNFLLSSFQKLAPVEFFHVQRSKKQLHNTFRQTVSVVFNASEQNSQIDAFLVPTSTLDATPAQLEQRQAELLEYIGRICGLPRYSYIENDDMYLQGKTKVPFTHKLLLKGHHLMGNYDITPSTIEEPFCLLTGQNEARDVLPHVRHNFQRLHKMESMLIKTGLLGLQAVAGSSPETDVNVDFYHVIDTAALMDVEHELSNVSENPIGREKFRGFQS